MLYVGKYTRMYLLIFRTKTHRLKYTTSNW